MNLENLSPNSKTWIYQSDRYLTMSDTDFIEKSANVFIESWNAHGSALKAKIKVLHNYFVLIVVDESVANASGCSIDKSVHFIKDIGNQLKVDFFNRLNIAVETENGIELFHYTKLSDEIKKGNISADSITFDNTLTTIDSFQNSWKIALQKSWVAKQL